jgi:hypothetical protein
LLEDAYPLEEIEDTVFSSSDISGVAGEFIAIVYDEDDNPVFSGFLNFTEESTGWAYERSGSEELKLPLSVTIVPNPTRLSNLPNGSRLRAFVRQRSPIFASMVDSENEPIDLSGRTLEFRITTAGNVPFLTVPSEDITVTGVDSNSFFFTPPDSLVERAKVFQWVLIDVTDDTVLGTGELEVVHAP